MSDDSSRVRSGVGPDRTGYLPNWERVRSLVSRVYADASAQLLFIVFGVLGDFRYARQAIGWRKEN